MVLSVPIFGIFLSMLQKLLDICPILTSFFLGKSAIVLPFFAKFLANVRKLTTKKSNLSFHVRDRQRNSFELW